MSQDETIEESDAQRDVVVSYADGRQNHGHQPLGVRDTVTNTAATLFLWTMIGTWSALILHWALGNGMAYAFVFGVAVASTVGWLYTR